jgi:DNA-binding MarR family transcriptional regulator
MSAAAPAATTSADRAASAEMAGRLRLCVTRLARQLRQEGDTGLSPTLLATLATVDAAGPLTLGELAARERVAPPTVTKAVAALEEGALVARCPDPNDRRVTRVTVTREGRTVLSRSRTRKDAWLARRLRALPPEELAALARAVGALEHLAEGPK